MLNFLSEKRHKRILISIVVPNVSPFTFDYEYNFFGTNEIFSRTI